MYSVDEQGNLISVPISDDEVESLQSLHDSLADFSDYTTVSGGDAYGFSGYDVSDSDIMPLMASNSVYPDRDFVDVSVDIISGLGYIPDYVIVPGEDSYHASLIYSKNSSVNGSTLSFSGDVHVVSIARERINNSFYYYFNQGEVSSYSVIMDSASLYYTNIIRGYPDPVSRLSNTSSSLFLQCGLVSILILSLCIYSIVRRLTK